VCEYFVVLEGPTREGGDGPTSKVGRRGGGKGEQPKDAIKVLGKGILVFAATGLLVSCMPEGEHSEGAVSRGGIQPIRPAIVVACGWALLWARELKGNKRLRQAKRKTLRH